MEASMLVTVCYIMYFVELISTMYYNNGILLESCHIEREN